MGFFFITHPAATVSRGIENLVLYGEHSNFALKTACATTARLISAVVLPTFLTLELCFLRIPKLLFALRSEKCQQKANKTLKYLFYIIPSIPFGFYHPNAISSFFLKRPKTDREVLPFGVEHLFGRKIHGTIQYPQSIADVQKIVIAAKKEGRQVSIIGTGMSEGPQTVPRRETDVVIHTKHLNSIRVNLEDNTVTVGAGATWEEVQLKLDSLGKSVIVKQASDMFSIGGSIGINCHGWAHLYGAISKTVSSLKMIDAEGRLRVLSRPAETFSFDQLTDDEKLFKCLFGTLGYFGVVVEATLQIVDNSCLQEEVEEIDLSQFLGKYQVIRSDPRVELFGGRLGLNLLDKDFFNKVYMTSYRKFSNQPQIGTITRELKNGTYLERVGLTAICYLPNHCAQRLISYFWAKKKKEMLTKKTISRNTVLHSPMNALKMFHHSDYYTQWLQEYFIKPSKLESFIRFLGAQLKTNGVRLINATIRPTPKDVISILPYSEEDRYAIVICFVQQKTAAEIAKTKKWIETVHAYLAANKGIFYQAYMPYATREEFESCYGAESIERMRALKKQFDPSGVFGSGHTARYFDSRPTRGRRASTLDP